MDKSANALLKKAAVITVIGKNPRRTLLRMAFTTLFFLLLFRYILIPVRVHGTSMEPAYRDGSLNLINTLAYAADEPRRGDVVGIRFAGRRILLFKRIIGLPGEKLGFEDGRLSIDGQFLPEPYLRTAYGWTMPEVEIGPGEYFVAGDNRRSRLEDHSAGRVHKGRILGRAVF